MTEHAITIPVSMLLPLGGAVVAVLGWLFNLQGRVKAQEQEFTAYKAAQQESSAQYRTTVAAELSALHAAKHDQNNKLHTHSGRLDLCEERHRTFVAEHRREVQRLSADYQLSQQLSRMQRSLQAGKVVTLEDALDEDQ
jgi:hypothetical protein